MDRSEIDRYVTGAEYPSSKADLIAMAVANGAPQEVVEALQALSGERFIAPDDVHLARTSGDAPQA